MLRFTINNPYAMKSSTENFFPIYGMGRRPAENDSTGVNVFRMLGRICAVYCMYTDEKKKNNPRQQQPK